jgi:cell division inhibitor SepF
MLVRMYHAIARFFGKVLDRILLVDEEATTETYSTETDEQDDFRTSPAEYAAVPPSAEDTQSLDGRVHVMRNSTELQICIARPRNIEEAEHVGERLKRRLPVILNLESTDEAMAQRIADYMSGAVHMVDAKIAKGGRMVWVYAPVDMGIELLKADQEQPKAHLFADEEPPLRTMASGM